MTKLLTRRIEINGRLFDATPCSVKHADYVDRGWVALSCKKCRLVSVRK